MKRWMVIVCVICMVTCVGCGQESADPTQYLLDEQFYTEEYLAAFDVQMQYAESQGRVVKVDTVYYIYSYDTRFLYYYDENSGVSGKLCGKAECLHEDTNCNAYLGFTMNMQVYDEHIYWLESGHMLYRADLAGNGRELVRDLKNEGAYYFTIHRGYLYLREYRGEVQGAQQKYVLEIKQYILEDKNDEGKSLFLEESSLNTRYMIQFHGNTMYLALDQYESISDPEWDRRIMTYNIGSGEWKTLVEETVPGWIRSMYIENNMIHTVEQKMDARQSQVSVREIAYDLAADKKTEGLWLDFEPNKTKLAHIADGHMLLIESAPQTEEIMLKYQVVDAEGNESNTGSVEGLQPMYCGADETGFFVRLTHSTATATGMEFAFKMVRIPYDSDAETQYLVDDTMIVR